MYCRKVRAYIKDEKLLMHFFQESLIGEAAPGTLIWNLPESILGKT